MGSYRAGGSGVGGGRTEAAGAREEQLQTIQAQAVYPRVQRLSRELMAPINTRGKQQAWDELFKLKDSAGTRTKGIN